jgi:predicted PurR-regulated permease PerM
MFEFFKNKHTVVISPISIMFTIFFVLGLYFLYYIQSILILLLLAFIIMVALNPTVKRLERRLHLPKVWSIIVVYSLFLLCISLVLAVLIPPLASQVYQLVRHLQLPVLEEEIVSFSFTLQEMSELISRMGDSVNVLFSLVNAAFNTLFTIFTLVILSVFMMLERPTMAQKILWFSRKNEHVERVARYLDQLEVDLGGWVRGQLIIMLLVGLMNFIGLTLLGIPYAIPLAILAGLLEILPNLGPTLAAAPAVIIAYMAFGWPLAVVVLVMAILIQQIENNLLVPKVMKASANVNPLIAITAILIGLRVAGVMGALLGIPFYIIIRTTYSFFLRPGAEEIEE